MELNKDVLEDINKEVLKIGGSASSNSYKYNIDVLKDILSNVETIAGSGGAGLNVVIVEELPTTGETHTIYLVPNSGTKPNIYDEYMYIANDWEKIGSTDIDLSNYYTKTQTDNLLDDKQDEIDSSHKLDADLVDDTSSTNKFVTSEEKTTWSGKQDTLTFDTTPTQNSTNPVTSNGIYEALSSAGGIKMEAYNSFQSSFNIYDADIGIYNFKNQDGGINFYYDKNRPDISFLKSYTNKIMDLTIIKKVDWETTATATEIYAYLTLYDGTYISKVYFYRSSGNSTGNYSTGTFTNALLSSNSSATISGSWNFNALPTAKSSLKANYANQLVPRSFVDNYIASNYNPNNTYAVGDLVIYGTDLYQCNTAIETPEAWDSTKWTQTTLADAIKGSSS